MNNQKGMVKVYLFTRIISFDPLKITPMVADKNYIALMFKSNSQMQTPNIARKSARESFNF